MTPATWHSATGEARPAGLGVGSGASLPGFAETVKPVSGESPLGRRSFRDQPPPSAAVGRGADLQEWLPALPWAGGPLSSHHAPGVRAGVGGVRGTGARSANLEQKGKSSVWCPSREVPRGVSRRDRK